MQNGSMKAPNSLAPARFWLLLVGCALVMFASAGGARAQSCNDDLAKLGQKRGAQIEALNGIAKANKGKLDPVAACPRFRELASIENEMVAYLVKNKDWCNIPDEFLNNFKTGSAKSNAMATQACAIAAKVKKMQKEQALGGGGGGNLGPAPKLPAGPL